MILANLTNINHNRIRIFTEIYLWAFGGHFGILSVVTYNIPTPLRRYQRLVNRWVQLVTMGDAP